MTFSKHLVGSLSVSLSVSLLCICFSVFLSFSLAQITHTGWYVFLSVNPWLLHTDTSVKRREKKKKSSVKRLLARTSREPEFQTTCLLSFLLTPLIGQHYNSLELEAWAPSLEYVADAKEGRQEQSALPCNGLWSQVIPLPKWMVGRSVNLWGFWVEWQEIKDPVLG